jgi:hypothetical protein
LQTKAEPGLHIARAAARTEILFMVVNDIFEDKNSRWPEGSLNTFHLDILAMT